MRSFDWTDPVHPPEDWLRSAELPGDRLQEKAPASTSLRGLWFSRRGEAAQRSWFAHERHVSRCGHVSRCNHVR